MRWSRTAGLLWSLADRRFASGVAEAENAVLARPKGHSPQAQGPRLGEGVDATTRVVEVWQRSSLQMARLCGGLGIPYFHFLQPNQYVPDSKPMDEAERRVAWRDDSPMHRPVAEGYARLRAAGAELAAEGVAFEDLSACSRTCGRRCTWTTAATSTASAIGCSAPPSAGLMARAPAFASLTPAP